MYDLVVCAVFKNESHILTEWIEHYLKRDVDHIFLIDDFSTDDYMRKLEPYMDKVTLFKNDIVTKERNRQPMVYEKYLRPILGKTKWMAILDLDEFLYSPTNEKFKDILGRYENISQIRVDWLFFGSNAHIKQPVSVVNGFTMRAKFVTDKSYYSFKSIVKTSDFISFGLHIHDVCSQTVHCGYSDNNPPPFVINHYAIQSFEFFMKIKATRGDCDNHFDHSNLKRNETYFKEYDLNEVVDTRLLLQNKPLVNLSREIGTSDEITLVITSCNRPFLLKETLESFVKQNTYPIKETFIIEDSGVNGCNVDAVKDYEKLLNITCLYNSKNIGQVESIDRAYSYVRTKWIFHCEEDWKFLQPQFIEKSMRVFNDNPNEKIFTVWLRPHNHTSGHPIIHDKLNRGYFLMHKHFTHGHHDGKQYAWGGITFNPGLRKTSDCLIFHPYSVCLPKSQKDGKEYVGEYVINTVYKDLGYYAMILADPNGHVTHIGDNHHIPRFWD
jgi:hypothetical protein